jgi:hypothetical protein
MFAGRKLEERSENPRVRGSILALATICKQIAAPTIRPQNSV